MLTYDLAIYSPSSALSLVWLSLRLGLPRGLPRGLRFLEIVRGGALGFLLGFMVLVPFMASLMTLPAQAATNSVTAIRLGDVSIDGVCCRLGWQGH